MALNAGGRRRGATPWLIFAFSVTLTLAMCLSYWVHVRRRDARRFQQRADFAAQRVKTRLSVCASMLQGAAGLLAAQSDVTSSRFHAYVEVLDVSRAYFGIQDLGYAAPQSGPDASGMPLTSAWPASPGHVPVTVRYLEPSEAKNQRLLGFDILSDAVRREAAERAMDEGRPALTARLRLIRDEGDPTSPPGLLMWVPVYRGGVDPGTKEGRRKGLQGFVFASFHPQELVQSIFEAVPTAPLDFALYDGTDVTPEHLLYATHPPRSSLPTSAFGARETFDVAGRTWTLTAHSHLGLEPESGLSFVGVLLLGGLLLSVGVFFLSRSQDRAREALEKMNADLLESERALVQESRTTATLLRIASTFGSELDEAKLVQSVTDEGRALTGAQFGAFFHKVVDERGQGMLLYTLSGAPRAAFEKFPIPRPTALFGITFRGERIVRIADVHDDPLYGKSAPFHGMPPGHPPVRSYLAAPVTSRSGEVLGGLFFGHAQPGVFTAEHEQLMAGVAAQAAVALDNARLFKEAQEAVRLRDEFMSIASHELRTPLTPLRLQLDTMQRSLKGEALAPLADAFGPKLKSATRQTERLTALVESLLDVSRLGRGALQLERERVDLGVMVNEVVERFSDLLQSAGCTLELEVEPGVVGEWDALRIEQVVTNLLSNALKYGAGSPLRVQVQARGPLAVLSVTDRGIGIAAADLERIFQRFERAVAATSYGGLGLGLFITRRIVEVHQGRVWATSTPGQGATFTVELPRAVPPA